MTIESIIGITSGLIAIGGAVVSLYKMLKKRSLTELMNQLVDKRLSNEQHRKILRKMNKQLGFKIKNEYIQKFVLNDRGKETVFMDICDSNNIEPKEDICKKFLNVDMKKFRTNYYSKRANAFQSEKKDFPLENPLSSSPTLTNEEQTVFMSELLMNKFPETCKNLIKKCAHLRWKGNTIRQNFH